MLKRRPAGKKFTNQNQNINIIQYTEEKKLSLQSNVVIRLSSMDGRIQDFQMINLAATASLESVRALLDPWSDDFSDPCCWPVCTVSLVSLSPRDKHYQIWWWCQWVSVHSPCHCTVENLKHSGGHSFRSENRHFCGHFDHVERVLDTYFTQFPLRKASGAIRNY